MSNKLNDLRKRIYINLKEKAYGLEGEVTDELKTYREDQVKNSKRPFQASNLEELKKSVTSADIVYLGDFHTFDQNIRNVLRVLKVIASGHKNCAIGLEMVHARHQVCLDAYMGNHLTELEFLESIHYHDSWRFPWTHYKLIFELAKEHHIRMIALNTDGNLRDRDAYAANILVENLNLAPTAQIVVVYGELHISRDKIPALVKSHMREVKQTVIHQNLDEVYWSLKSHDENEKIVKFGGNEFCINSAPPWVKYESMIYWYENLDDDPDFDIHEYIIENGKKIFSDDTYENFLTISSQLSNMLRLKVDEDELESFNLRDHTGLEFIEEKISQIKSDSLAKFYNDLITKGQSFRLAGEDTFYCSSYSMNRISYLAGIHIFYNWLKENKGHKNKIVTSENNEELFLRVVFESMHAFFFSKIMNPHRKCDMYFDLRHALNHHESRSRMAAIGALDGQDPAVFLQGLGLNESHNAAEICGHIFGEYLYVQTFEQDGTKDFSQNYMDLSFDHESFERIRTKLLRGIDYKNHKKRYF